ncbi:MAG TPA: hypothetical protein VKB38_20710 [Terracidiphilus sp.]|nr:hypothetical protein [Terracidiphilus sp.]
MPYLLISAVFVAVVISAAAWNRRAHKEIEEAADWPTTEATVQQTEVQEFIVNNRRDVHEYPCFTFSYVVNDDYYSGVFGLAVEGEPADRLRREMIDKKFALNYKPTEPAEYYIADEMMDGYEMLQRLSARGTLSPEE